MTRQRMGYRIDEHVGETGFPAKRLGGDSLAPEKRGGEFHRPAACAACIPPYRQGNAAKKFQSMFHGTLHRNDRKKPTSPAINLKQ